MQNKKPKKLMYKHLLASRKNVTNSATIYKFKKKKWNRFKFFAKLKLRYFRRYRFFDQARLYVDKFASRGNSFKKNFKNHLNDSKTIKLIYGELKKKPLRKVFAKVKTNSIREPGSGNLAALLTLEQKLDSVLCRAYFCSTIKQARQMVLHGHVEVNGEKRSSYTKPLNPGDKVSIAKNPKSRKIVKDNLACARFWPIPPKFLKVNYRTLQVINSPKDCGNDVMFFFNYGFRVDTFTNNVKYW